MAHEYHEIPGGTHGTSSPRECGTSLRFSPSLRRGAELDSLAFARGMQFKAKFLGR